MKQVENHRPVAHELARELEPADRRLFLVGCGLAPGALELFEATRTSDDGAHAYLDPRPAAASVRCPVYLVHGLDDDVIPYTQLEALRRMMPDPGQTRAYLTGLYAHTGTARLADRLRSLPALAREGWTMVQMVAALVKAGTATTAAR